MFAELAPLPGDVICDIGCGTGSELIRIARIVGPEGNAIGVDPSTTMIEETRTALSGRASPLNCSPGTDETPGFQRAAATPFGWNEWSNTSAISPRSLAKRSASRAPAVASSSPTPTGAL